MTNLTWVYLIKDRVTGFYKIGRSDTPLSRLKTLCRQDTKQPTPNEFELIEAWWCDARNERDLHGRFRSKSVRGEWFELQESDLDDLFQYFFQCQRFSEPQRFDSRDEIGDLFERLTWAEQEILSNRYERQQQKEQLNKYRHANNRLIQALTNSNDYVRKLQEDSRRAWDFADQHGFNPRISERLKELPSLATLLQKVRS